jgi:hypothetical protein
MPGKPLAHAHSAHFLLLPMKKSYDKLSGQRNDDTSLFSGCTAGSTALATFGPDLQGKVTGCYIDQTKINSVEVKGAGREVRLSRLCTVDLLHITAQNNKIQRCSVYFVGSFFLILFRKYACFYLDTLTKKSTVSN